MIQSIRCPVCGNAFTPTDEDHPSPFCNERCRQIDLLRWSKGSYAITEDLDPDVVEFLKHDPNIAVEDDES